jgi:hypothetical protein
MYGNNKVYTDQSGGESQTIVNWVKDMVAFNPGVSPAGSWSNVECTDCTRVLAGDPRPPVIPTPPFFNVSGVVRVVCP